MTNRIKAGLGMLREKGAFHILSGNFATKFVTMFGSIFLTRLLTKEDMGLLTYMENLAGYAIIFAGLGMANVMLRYGVLSKSKEDHYGIYTFVLRSGLAADVTLALLFILINAFYPHKAVYETAARLLPLYILYVPFQDIVNNVQMNERASFNNRRFAFISVLSAAAMVAARMAGAFWGGLTGVVIGLVLIQVLTAVVLLWDTKRHYFRHMRPKMPDRATKKSATIYAVQYMITNGLWGIFMLMDIFLIANLLGNPATIADYKIAYTIPANMAIFSGAIGVFVTPYFVKHEEEPGWVSGNYLKTLAATALLLLAVSGGLIIFTKPIIWIFGEQYYNVIPLMRMITLACFVENVFRFPTANILAAIGMVKVNMIVSAIGFGIKIILNLLFIPTYGIYSVPIISIVVQALMGLGVFLVFNKRYDVTGYVMRKWKRKRRP